MAAREIGEVILGRAEERRGEADRKSKSRKESEFERGEVHKETSIGISIW